MRGVQAPSSNIQAAPARALILSSVMAALFAVPGMAQWTKLSTRDYTTTAGSPTDLIEACADSKSPGNGSIYTAGSIQVVDTQNSPTYSGSSVLVSPYLPTFNTPSFRRQVAIIQESAATGGGISRQAYYHGISNLGPEIPGLHTNARAISVWPAATLPEMRIAICGETSDRLLPLTQDNAGTTSTSGAPIYSGFIAVFDGSCTLLWSHHLVGRSETGHCAVTDVSIRVVDTEEGPADLVTYCGISSHGVDLNANGQPTTANRALMPVGWFTPAPAGAANGKDDNGAGQLDGFVGRIRNVGSRVAGQTVDFHASVGGQDQDGLFGVAEMPDERIVVVGSTASTAYPGPSGLLFPFTIPSPNQPTSGNYCMGTVLTFDASATPGGNVVLEAGTLIGTGSATADTIARDVLVQQNAVHGDLSTTPPVSPLHAIYVVGTTDDPSLFSNLLIPIPNPTPQALINTSGVVGPTDGYLLVAADTPGQPLVLFQQGSYRGYTGNDGLFGVGSWNEHLDHVTVFGEAEVAAGATSTMDFDVATYFADTCANPPAIPGTPAGVASPLIVLQQLTIAATLDQVPTAMGTNQVITGGAPVWDGHDLGSPAGGGVSVEERGRITVVGQTSAGAGYPIINSLRFGNFGSDMDAVRTDLDMLPAGPNPTNGIGRTDGTGLPTTIPSFATGGTTPAASLSPFGQQIGKPAPAMLRINIDFEGSLPSPLPPGGSPRAVLVDRPPFAAPIAAAILEWGIPSNPMTLHTGWLPAYIELWVNPGSGYTSTFSQLGVPGLDQSVRFSMTFPPGNNVFVAQAVCMLANGTFAASPGMVINY